MATVQQELTGIDTTENIFVDDFNMGPSDKEIFKCIQLNPNLSRFEISEMTLKRVSTVCSGVDRLINKYGLVKVSGKKLDTDTNKYVDTLAAKLGGI